MNLNLLWRQATAGQEYCSECGQALMFVDSETGRRFCPECENKNDGKEKAD